jgi:DNA-binding MarR family transcriptional regulator
MPGWLRRFVAAFTTGRFQQDRFDRQNERIGELNEDVARKSDEIDSLRGRLQASQQAEAKSREELRTRRDDSPTSERNMGWESESILLLLSNTGSMLASELAAAMDMPKTIVVLACRELADQGFITALDPSAAENREWQIAERGRRYLDLRTNR